MSPERPIKPSQGKQPSDFSVEIITPLEVRKEIDRPDSIRYLRSTAVTIFLFLIILASMAAGGFFLIRHVSKHPVGPVKDTKLTKPLESDPMGKKDLNASGSNKARTGAPESGFVSMEKPPETPPVQPTDTAGVEPEKEFSTALRIQPSDESVRRNLDRAEKVDDVNRLIASGKFHEENHRPGFALADFEKALQLDPESVKAQKGVSRLKEKIADEQFKKLMSEGLTAYHDGDYQLARTALLKAKSFRSDAPEVKSALLQVDEAVRLNAIEKLHEKARSAEQAENWEQALKSYLEVLNIDPDIRFGAQGKNRALEHVQVSKRIEFFLENPDAMASDRQLENAIRLIEDAEKLEQRGPNFNARLNRLQTLVGIAETPVKVIVESDNLTEITVYKVGKLGKFTVRELSLRPGSYTAVGSRNGYRDVRLNIIVKPGQNPLRVSVICDMKV